MKNPAYRSRTAVNNCPSCEGQFVKRKKGKCPFCGVGIAFGHEYFLDDSYYIDDDGIGYRVVKDNGKNILEKV